MMHCMLLLYMYELLCSSHAIRHSHTYSLQHSHAQCVLSPFNFDNYVWLCAMLFITIAMNSRAQCIFIYATPSNVIQLRLLYWGGGGNGIFRS